MKKILLVAATELEVKPFLKFLKANFKPLANGVDFQKDNLWIRVCMSGVGLMQSAAHIMEAVLVFQPDIAIQAGIAGSFDLNRDLGSLLIVSQDIPGDIGAESEDGFVHIADMGFADKNAFPFKDGWLGHHFPNCRALQDLPKVKGLSVNTISGIEATIEARKKRYDCVVESMEGASFHYVCLLKNICFVQLRSLSNYVMPRNKDQWEIEKAVSNLNDWLIRYIFTF